MGALDVVRTWPVATAAVCVVNHDGVVASVGPDEVLPWASTSKLVSALTALVSVHDGSVALDDPAGPPGSTVAHLLAHASGIAPDNDAVLAPPGRRRIYSNRGFELLADVVAAKEETTFAELLDVGVLRPLGMRSTRLHGSPAFGLHGPLSELASLGRELLSPTLVPELMELATRTAFPGLAGVLPGFGPQAPNDWGLGFEIRNGKRPHWTGSRNAPETFGHFGRSGSFLWVDPLVGLACACLTDREFGQWAATAWPDLSDRVLAEFAPSSG
jgi:CubicO group peptidase (beta-lactamase class C family)